MKDWDTSSLEAMKQTAIGQHDEMSCKKIDGKWFEVKWLGNLNFRYMYNNREIEVNKAIELMDKA